MIIQKKKGFLDGTWEEACCRSTPTWEGWTARHMGEATGELSEIKWRVRNPPIRESHVAGATEKKVQKMKGKMTKKPTKVPRVATLDRGIFYFSKYFSFIR